MDRLVLAHPASLRCFLLCLIVGIGFGSSITVLPSALILYVSLLVFAVSLFFYCRLLCPNALYLCGVFLGIVWSAWHAQILFKTRIPHSLAGSEWVLEGVVTGLPVRTEYGVRFDLDVVRIIESPTGSGSEVDLHKLRLNHYDRKRNWNNRSWSKSVDKKNHGKKFTEIKFKPGEYWRLRVRLKPPRGFVNPGAFDFEGWLLQQGYSAGGYVRDAKNPQENKKLHAQQADLRSYIDKSAYALQAWIEGGIDVAYQPLFSALVLGNKDAFSREMWDRLSHTGTIHLVVVSGLHIGLMAAAGYGLCLFLARVLYLPLRLLPAQIWAASGAVLLAAFYAGLCGFSLPTQRALIMVLCATFAIILRKQVSVITALLSAAALVLIWDPLSLFSASFWLSFGAVSVLLYAGVGRVVILQGSHGSFRSACIGFIKTLIKIQLCVSLGLLPILAWWMGSVPMIMPVANFFAVPWVSFVVMPLVMTTVCVSVLTPLIHFPQPAEWLVGFSQWSMDVLWSWLAFCEAFNKDMYFAKAGIPSCLGVLLGLFSLVSVLVLLAPRGVFVNRSYQFLMGFLLLMMVFNPWRKNIVDGEFVVSLLDVGQGLAILIETANAISVYDAGDYFSDKFDAGRDIVVPQIRQKGFSRVDTLIVSHSDKDHAGGVQGILNALEVNGIYSGSIKEITWRLKGSKTKLKPSQTKSCRLGQQWRQDGVLFEIVSPADARVQKNRNNQSCVLRISNDHASILVPGDIHSDIEIALAYQQPALLDSDVLIAPHHGSNSSSTRTFIKAVSPDRVLISAGYNSRYGHPHAAVLQRYQDAGVAVLRSDRDGALVLHSEDDFQSLHRARMTSGRYWHRW